MSTTREIIAKIQTGDLDEDFLDIYVDSAKVEYQKERYIGALQTYEELFGKEEVSIFSAPGRSEIGGNHTDHQQGEVLVASVNVDVIAITHKTEENQVTIVSKGYPKVTISLDNLEKKKEEEGTTLSLIKGILQGMRESGYQIGGFRAYLTSEVLIGAGLSSSAAFETVVGTIISKMYNEGNVSPVEIAQIGQYAENVYFGKPCGLMDQLASSVGNLVHIDFQDGKNPQIEKVTCDFSKFGYSLCITDTKSSHEDCTPEYAAVPYEMKQVAAVFGKEVLRQVSQEDLLENIQKVRENEGDRALLRALHFVLENERVQKETKALMEEDFDEFLKNVKASGDSSFKYLQNVYIHQDITHQNVSVALCISEMILGEKGVSRVHGGGFAGTIQAFVKNEAVPAYQKYMNKIFGEGACQEYKIRKYGGIQVI